MNSAPLCHSPPLSPQVKCPIEMLAEDRDAIGFSPSPTPSGRLVSPNRAAMSKVKKNKEKRQGMSTGKSWQYSRRKSPDLLSNHSSEEMVYFANFPDQRKQMNMSGKKKQEFKEANLNLDENPFVETKPKIGMKYGSLQLRTIYPASQAMYELSIIAPSVVLLLIMENLLVWKEKSGSSGEKLVLENHAVLGPKQDWKLTLKIPEQSSGMATQAMKMLSSMSFEEELMFPTSSDGWIVIPSLWKSKVRQSYFERKQFGLPRTFLPQDGIQISMKPLWKLCSED